MNANADIVTFNGEQIANNSEMLNGSLTASSATPESNAQLVAANSDSMADLLANVTNNKDKIEELLETSGNNAEALMKNKEEINERRNSIMENRKGISENKAKIS